MNMALPSSQVAGSSSSVGGTPIHTEPRGPAGASILLATSAPWVSRLTDEYSLPAVAVTGVTLVVLVIWCVCTFVRVLTHHHQEQGWALPPGQDDDDEVDDDEDDEQDGVQTKFEI